MWAVLFITYFAIYSQLFYYMYNMGSWYTENLQNITFVSDFTASLCRYISDIVLHSRFASCLLFMYMFLLFCLNHVYDYVLFTEMLVNIFVYNGLLFPCSIFGSGCITSELIW